ncbi:hypothetical protein IJ118_01005 [Candidatus Saccharibacteria bacterium]|nr:hypothetical protein [Candidatus Saccharibacteria bacterium]
MNDQNIAPDTRRKKFFQKATLTISAITAPAAPVMGATMKSVSRMSGIISQPVEHRRATQMNRFTQIARQPANIGIASHMAHPVRMVEQNEIAPIPTDTPIACHRADFDRVAVVAPDGIRRNQLFPSIVSFA